MTGIDIRNIGNNNRKGKDSSGDTNELIGNFIAFLSKDITININVINDSVREGFYHELAMLLHAGVDIKTALELIISGQRKNLLKSEFTSVKNDIISGSLLSEALKKNRHFSSYEYFSIQIGEEAGMLTTVLKELAQYYKNKVHQKRQLISALTYPLVVFLTAFGAIFFMLKFIVPMFEEIFYRFGADLPFITQLVLDTAEFFNTYFYIFLFVSCSLVIFFYINKRKKWFRKYYAELGMKIPVFGDLIRKAYLLRFCYAMQLLIASKVPIIRSLVLVKQMINFFPLEEAINNIEQRVIKGETLHLCMASYSIFPPNMITLIKVGEEINQMDIFLKKISDQLNNDINHKVSILSSLIEPFIIIFLGILVGVILIAMYLPLFKIGSFM